MKPCPQCKLKNPDTAERCDCGYDFTTGTMKESYVREKSERLPATAWYADLGVFGLLGYEVAGILGILGGAALGVAVMLLLDALPIGAKLKKGIAYTLIGLAIVGTCFLVGFLHLRRQTEERQAPAEAASGRTLRQHGRSALSVRDVPKELRGPLRPLSSEEHTALLQRYGETLSGQDQAEFMILLKKMLDVLAEDEAERFLELHAKGMVDISQAEIEERGHLQQKALSRLSQADRERFETLGIKAVRVDGGKGSADEGAGTLMGLLSAEEVAEMQRLMDKSLRLLSERDSLRLLQLHRLFRGEGSRQITQKEWQEMHALNKEAVGLLSAEEQARFQELMLKAAGFSKGARQEGHSESP